NAEPVYVIGELVEIGTVNAGIDQDQPTLPTHHDGVAPYPLALPDPDAVGHLIQHLMHSPIQMLLADTICGVVSPCGTSPARRTADSSTPDLFRSRNSSLPRGSLSLFQVANRGRTRRPPIAHPPPVARWRQRGARGRSAGLQRRPQAAAARAGNGAWRAGTGGEHRARQDQRE